MKKILALIILGGLAATACGGLRQECLGRQDRVARVAALANKDLIRGYGPYEVRALLGEPDDIITYSGAGNQEVWKYMVLEGCATHQGLGAPTTELIFVNGALDRWIVYGR